MCHVSHAVKNGGARKEKEGTTNNQPSYCPRIPRPRIPLLNRLDRPHREGELLLDPGIFVVGLWPWILHWPNHQWMFFAEHQRQKQTYGPPGNVEKKTWLLQLVFVGGVSDAWKKIKIVWLLNHGCFDSFVDWRERGKDIRLKIFKEFIVFVLY